MQKISHLLGCLILSASLLGCVDQVTLEDGKIPTEHLEIAKQIAGTYLGDFNKKFGKLELSIDAQNKVRFQFTDEYNSNELLDPYCESRVGNLRTVNLTKKNVHSGVFGFLPGKCQKIEGRELSVTFSDHYKKVHLSILSHYDWDIQCDKPTKESPRPQCRKVEVPRYLKGTLKRK